MRNLISCAYVTFATSLFVVTGFASADDADFRSLKRVNVADPPNLGEFIKDRQRAIELGKSLFWDTQMGSDVVGSPRVFPQRYSGM